MKNDFDYQAVRTQSLLYGEQNRFFDENLSKLETFEENVHYINLTFADVTLEYHNGEYMVKLGNHGIFPISEHAITNVFGKTGVDFKATKTVFDAIAGVSNLEGTRPLGFDYFSQALEKSKRDVREFSKIEHRFVIYNGRIVAVLNHNFPLGIVKAHRIISNFVDIVEIEGEEHPKYYLDFNEQTGLVDAKLMFTQREVKGASVNEMIRFGGHVKNGYFGTSNYIISLVEEVLACSNGMTSTKSNTLMKARNSSVGNIAKAFGNFCWDNKKGFINDRKQWSAITYARSGKIPNLADYTDAFYVNIARTLYDTLKDKVSVEMEIIERAASTQMSEKEFYERMDKVWQDNSGWMPKKDRENLEIVVEEDDTIGTNKTLYDLSLAFSRYANAPFLSLEKRENFQEVAREILVPVTV